MLFIEHHFEEVLQDYWQNALALTSRILPQSLDYMSPTLIRMKETPRS